jgi:hypothetical protein
LREIVRCFFAKDFLNAHVLDIGPTKERYARILPFVLAAFAAEQVLGEPAVPLAG